MSSIITSINNILLILFATSLIIGIAVAYNIKDNDTDKERGDKRLVAAVFIMSSVVFIGIWWTRENCREGIRSTLYNTTGIYLPDPAKARAAGVRRYDF